MYSPACIRSVLGSEKRAYMRFVEAALCQIVLDGMRSERAVLEDVGKNVRMLRKAHGLSQPELAGLVGVSEQNIRAIESGAVNVTAKTLIAIANVFHRELFELCMPTRSKTAAGYNKRRPNAAEIEKMIDVGRIGRRLKQRSS